MNATYRYRLFSKMGKDFCPSCGRKTFVPYQDTRTNELLPEEFGRCDREANCNYSLSPYDKGQSGQSYADEIFDRDKQQWKEDNNFPDRSQHRQHSLRRPTVAPEPPLPILQTLPFDIATRSLSGYADNNFVHLLRSHFGMQVANELIQRFRLGTYKADYELTYKDGDQFVTQNFGKGGCIFWAISADNKIYGGQGVLFDRAGKTVKFTYSDGEIDRTNRPIVYLTKQFLKNRKKTIPDWLTKYETTDDKFPVPFGLHQISSIPSDQTIAVVESPKTAMLAAGHFPKLCWMAIWSLSYLTSPRLSPLRRRKIVLFPDSSANGKAFERWKEKAAELNTKGFRIMVSDYLEKHAAIEQKVQGYDLADFILHEWKGYPPVWDSKPGTVPTIRLVPSTNRFYYADLIGVSPDLVQTFSQV